MPQRRLVSLVVCASGLLAASLAWAATNLNTSRSNVYRVGGAIVMSGGASLNGPNQSQAALTVPEAGDFVLTQVCVSPVNGGMRLEVRNGGPLAHLTDPTCVALQPGISVKAGSTLTCATTSFAAPGGDYFCMVSGVYAR